MNVLTVFFGCFFLGNDLRKEILPLCCQKKTPNHAVLEKQPKLGISYKTL